MSSRHLNTYIYVYMYIYIYIYILDNIYIYKILNNAFRHSA